jgi:hypothetical protein
MSHGTTYAVTAPGIASATFSKDPVDGGLTALIDDVTFAACLELIEVSIDIKPGSNPNTIKLSNKGSIPVAILGTADFDAPAEVDRTSLTFGRTGDEASLAFCGTTLKDVNADLLPDLVCHFATRLTGFPVGDTEGILRGETVDGTAIEGRDAVRVIR